MSRKTIVLLAVCTVAASVWTCRPIASAQAPAAVRRPTKSRSPAAAPSRSSDATSGPADTSGPVDTVQSRVYIKVGKVGFGHEHAIEGRVASGLIRLGADAAAGQLVFDLQSFQADTDAAREFVGLKGSVDEDTRKSVAKNMLSAEVLAAAKFPKATFVIQSASRQAGDNDEAPQYVLDGAFTLHGVTRPLQIVAVATQVGDRVNLSGKFDVLQTDYGIRPYSRALGAVKVANRLEIFGEVVLQTGAVDRNLSR